MSHANRTSQLTSYVVIPARLASTRLPQKMLLRDTGKSLIQHTYESARQATRPLGVCVATEDRVIADEVVRFGGQAVLTEAGIGSGTDRVARVAREAAFAGIDVVVNVQGDEPELDGEQIDRLVEMLESHPDAVMATLSTPIRSRAQLDDPSCVKVIFDRFGRALYFSRAAIPAVRNWNERLLTDIEPHFYQHLGIYAYRRAFLLELAKLPPTDREQLEDLEQLRVLDAGHTIQVGVVERAAAGIDTVDDYRAFVERRKSA
ncbi:MAG: 3-deoxy-manno-octulosonate cytidylyltransferase [Planctomycetota bacterium]|nr:MAG: 3-deoxy-manno-octulosonate cytidylyltransferase [Planctomycetota bacterium]REJ90543.1 MAG: 3-deoxy-manno-octulosonate cytidylyltransferase [Planctomycetota bacterium]REK23920.1 MAG: 3-deoxy-manno-octulosonate cytidylyltransferase [Planctomycetota bacterium]REK43216.1 MAG: 3-deoxy-manno-octulosonate cytidylyltransferase [Planctomycetota bacterium]